MSDLRTATTDGTLNPNLEPMMQWFEYRHLPVTLQDASRPFCELAEQMLKLPRNPERSTMFRKLLEAKDCAVRAVIYK